MKVLEKKESFVVNLHSSEISPHLITIGVGSKGGGAHLLKTISCVVCNLSHLSLENSIILLKWAKRFKSTAHPCLMLVNHW